MTTNLEVKQPSSNFHMSFFFLSKEKRQAMFNFYQFCRYADDLVDDLSKEDIDHIKDAKLRLKNLREEVNLGFSGTPRTDLGQKIQKISKHFPVKKEHFLEIIDGCEMDLFQDRYETFEDLYQYCYRVASAVGLVSQKIFGCTENSSRDYAINLGVAFQLTNILRDIKEDFERDRVYLPREDFDRFGYSEEMLANREVNDAFFNFMNFQCERAKDYYKKADENLCREDQKNLLPAEIMRSVYWTILKKINKNPALVFKGKVGFSKMKKIYLSLLACMNIFLKNFISK